MRNWFVKQKYRFRTYKFAKAKFPKFEYSLNIEFHKKWTYWLQRFQEERTTWRTRSGSSRHTNSCSHLPHSSRTFRAAQTTQSRNAPPLDTKLHPNDRSQHSFSSRYSFRSSWLQFASAPFFQIATAKCESLCLVQYENFIHHAASSINLAFLLSILLSILNYSLLPTSSTLFAALVKMTETVYCSAVRPF